MVSRLAPLLVAVAGFGVAQVTPAPQQSQPAPESSSGTQVAPQPVKALSPEVRGDIAMARKMYREAIDYYQEGIKSKSGDRSILSNKIGIGYHQMMDLRVAEKYYKQAIKLNPKYSEAINNLGTIYYARKSYRRAINQYKKALRLAPESASIYSNLGTAYFARKKYEDASKAYQQALALDPEVFEHRSTQGVLLQERSVEERAKFHFYLAKTYAKAGMNDRAFLYLRKALEEGFKDKQKMAEDPDFAKIKDMPEFKQLLAMEPRVL